jgi:MFS family permease
MALMGLTTFLPMYVQGVLHRSPVIAGLSLTMMMVGWPSGATFAARSFQRLGLRRVMLGGSIFLPAGALVFFALSPTSSPAFAGVGSLLMGFGMGTLSVSSLVLIQEIVDTSQRGSATASNLFSRNLGSTIGATLFGAVFNYGLAHAVGVGSVTADQLRQLLGAPSAAVASMGAVRVALHQSLHLTFSSIVVISLMAVLCVTLVPAAVLARLQGAPSR